MKRMIQNATFRIVRRVFILSVLLLCCAVFYLSDSPAEAHTACFDSYELCHDNCDDLPNPQDRPACHSNCLMPYGNCVNQAQLDKQGEIISFYGEGQPMPILMDFLNCIQNCPTCSLLDYEEDPEGYQECVENYLACKTSCIAQYS